MEQDLTFKTCRKCGEDKPLSEFNYKDRKKNRFSTMCKPCEAKYKKQYSIDNKEAIKEHSKCYREQNKEKLSKNKKQYYENNKAKLIAYQKDYREINPTETKKRRKEEYLRHRDANIKRACTYAKEHPVQTRLNKKKYAETHRDKKYSYKKQRLKDDIEFKIKENLRSRLSSAIRNQSAKKTAKTFDLIGCSIQYFIQYIEAQFKECMTWDNHGLYGWHIDHIRPCSSFDLTDPEQQKQCFHYTNLQPLWAEDNLKKSDKYIA